jgi:hypothetical protein
VFIRTIDALWEASREMVVNWKRLVLRKREISSILVAGVAGEVCKCYFRHNS